MGWGIILPDRQDVDDSTLAKGEDAPDAIQRLLASRPNSVVLRYRADLANGFLRRYYTDRSPQDLSAIGGSRGVGVGQLPLYLMIFAAPSEIPWTLQYLLNLSRCVGRLDRSGRGWENYVEALISGWPNPHPDTAAPVVWSVDHGGSDITSLMAAAVADKLWQKFLKDTDANRRVRLHGRDATAANLATALHDCRPAFVVTTSHGMTGPLNDGALLVSQLGLPVDGDYSTVDPMVLLGGWDPNGAMWYAHACCSAGSDTPSRFQALFSADDPLESLLGGVATLAGARVAPLAQALLGAKLPARAFVGHVEPTFDWTLRNPLNRQVLSDTLVRALYSKLFHVERNGLPTPVGYALADIYKEAGAFFADWQAAYHDVNGNVAGASDRALYAKLVALDRQSIVILGDPTVSLPLAAI